MNVLKIWNSTNQRVAFFNTNLFILFIVITVVLLFAGSGHKLVNGGQENGERHVCQKNDPKNDGPVLSRWSLHTFYNNYVENSVLTWLPIVYVHIKLKVGTQCCAYEDLHVYIRVHYVY